MGRHSQVPSHVLWTGVLAVMPERHHRGAPSCAGCCFPQYRERGSRNVLAVLERLVSLIGVWSHVLECHGTPPPRCPTCPRSGTPGPEWMRGRVAALATPIPHGVIGERHSTFGPPLLDSAIAETKPVGGSEYDPIPLPNSIIGLQQLVEHDDRGTLLGSFCVATRP